jgi:hypothetical protein
VSFSVEPSSLPSYARQLVRADDDLATIAGYVVKHAAGGTGGELITIARTGHLHAMGVITSAFASVSARLSGSVPELHRAAAYYRHSDLAALAALDRTLPVAGRCPSALELEYLSNPCLPAPFTDSRNPGQRLVPPPEPDDPQNSMAFMDYVSPASWAMKGFDIVLGFDPVAWVQEQFVGDWESLAAMRAVLTNAGRALHDIALNIQSGATTLHGEWVGNAGDAAYGYFTTLAAAIADLTAPLDGIGRAYAVMAESVWAAGEAIGGVLKAMIDAAIIAGISASAGTVTAGTGVGAVVGYGIAAAEVAVILKMWGDATKLYQNASAAVLAFRSALEHNLSGLESVILPELPAGAGYDHPLVTAAR